MAKPAVYGISAVTLANPVAGDYPASWSGADAFTFRAIVKDSVKFTDEAGSDNDFEVEESDTIFATLSSSTPKKGFELDTYDLSEEAYTKLQGFQKDDQGWLTEPIQTEDLVKAVQIITRKYQDIPSRTFQWANMKIKVTKAGTIGKSGFPNFHLVFAQNANFDENGQEKSCHRWKLTDTHDAVSLDYTTDKATTRKLVPLKNRYQGMVITYNPGDGVIIEQYMDSRVSDTEWAKDDNWVTIQ